MMPDEEECPDCGEEKHKFWWDCEGSDEDESAFRYYLKHGHNKRRQAPEFILKGNGWPGKGEVKE
jgi:hypothetical protein